VNCVITFCFLHRHSKREVQRSETSDLESRCAPSWIPDQPLRLRCVPVWNDATFVDFKSRMKLYPLAFALLLSACAADGGQGLDLESRSIAVEQNAVPTSGAGATNSVAHLLPETGPTYVALTVSRKDPSGAGDRNNTGGQAVTSGSGYVVDSTGYVMTAAHVGLAVGNLVSAQAANGRVYSGTVIALKPENDMSIIKLRGFSGKAVTPAAPGCIARGDLVYTLGKPHAQGDLARVGAFEAKHFGRAVAYGKFGYPDALVLRMGTQKGESGGPVFDGNGKLVGMVVSTLSDATGRSINLAHAIPSTALANFLCSSTACSAQWTALATRSVDDCGGA
jgi:S1-C subfamily serine protease